MSMGIPASIRPVILSGGSGTRLWPLSRSDNPKQMLPLLPPDTLLQATARRVLGSGFLPSYVVANNRHASAIAAQLDGCGAPADAMILEPMGRNTAPAIAAAAALAAETAPATLLLVMPSDHVIANPEAFHRAIARAAPVAAEGWLVTFGITPTGPETGYGYIEAGESIARDVRRVVRFVEKPDRETAEDYLASGRFAWNGGIFLFRADAILDALGHCVPAIRDAALSSIAGARREGPVIRPDPLAFAASPSQSIDYAVMERWDRVAMVPAEMGWSDIGSWDALHEFAEATGAASDDDDHVVAIDTENCLIRTSGPLVAAVGIKDLIVIATDDAVLVAPRGRSQEVRHLVAELQKRGDPVLDRSSHRHASWGHSRLLTRCGGIELHEAIVEPAQSLSGFGSGGGRFTVLAGSADVNGERLGQGADFSADAAIAIRNAGDEQLHLLIRMPVSG